MRAELQQLIAMKFKAFELIKGTKRPACKWKDSANWKSPTNMPSSEWVRWPGWGAVAIKFAVIDFDEDKSRSTFPEGVLHHFCATDGVSFSDLEASGYLLKTPHGYHLLVREEDAIDQGQGFALPDGRASYIDVRAHGKGYIVGPGTQTADGEYLPACGWDSWCDRVEQNEMPWLNKILPSVYSIVTHQNTLPISEKKSFSLRRGVTESKQYDGTSTWTPASFEEGLAAVESAAPGTAHGVMCGLMRVLRGRSSNPGFEVDIERVIEACRRRRIPQGEIDNALRDFVYSHIEERQQRKDEEVAKSAGVPAKDVHFIRSDKDVIVACESNVITAARCGYIKTSDFVCDAYGSLIWKSRREQGENADETLEAIAYDSEAEMVCRIDRFLGAKASSATRKNWLPAVYREVEKRGREELGHSFLEDIRSSGQTIPLSQLVSHMGVGGDVATATRWIEVCLLQALRRMLAPASPLGNILILWGPQGTRKSTFIPSLFDPSYLSPKMGLYRKNAHSYVDTYTGDLRDEAAVGQRLLGRFCVELPEMTAMRRTSDIGMIRDVITRTHDSYRAPYAPKPIKQPRTSTFICTANEEPCFIDQYGNRRFCPVNIAKKIDNEWIASHRVEIWRGLYVELQDDPDRATLTDEEQMAKEAALETGVLNSIFAFAEIYDVLCDMLTASRETVPLTEIMQRLTVDEKGPRLHNTKQLKDSVCDVLRHLGALRRPGRYPSYSISDAARGTLAAWKER